MTGSQQLIADQLGLVIDDTPHSGRPPVVNIVGGDRSSKQLVARQTTARFGLDLLRLPVALLPADADSLDLLTRLWQRECALLPVALYLDAHELEALARARRCAAADAVPGARRRAWCSSIRANSGTGLPGVDRGGRGR